MSRTAARFVVALVWATFLLTGPAAASVPGPTGLETGFASEPTPSNGINWLHRAQTLHAAWFRISVPWFLVAPARRPRHFNARNPADRGYIWQFIDAAVKTSVRTGQQPLLEFGGAPRWAEQHPLPRHFFVGAWRPSPQALAAFAHAIALRYSGSFPDPTVPGKKLPRVTYFQIWNEPNLPIDIEPQWQRVARNRYVPASPAIYRRLLNAGYVAIHRVRRDAHVLAAGTAPFGDPAGGTRMPPVVFLRELLCLRGATLMPKRCPSPAHFDALDHHPYGSTPGYHARNPMDVSVGDLGRLLRVVRRARVTHRVLPAGSKPLWVTEISWSTRPPDPAGISLAKQARYLALTMYQLWRQGVSHAFWLEIRDPLKLTGGFDEGSGVYFSGGRPKPSTNPFRFPFVALRGRGTVTVWGRSPSPGAVTVQVRSRSGWDPVAMLPTTAGGIFYGSVKLARGAYVRARGSSGASSGWRINR